MGKAAAVCYLPLVRLLRGNAAIVAEWWWPAITDRGEVG